MEEFDIERYKRECVSAYTKLKCTSKDDFGDWAKFASVAAPNSEGEILNLFCSDCVYSYRSKMKKEGKCMLPENGWDDINEVS